MNAADYASKATFQTPSPTQLERLLVPTPLVPVSDDHLHLCQKGVAGWALRRARLLVRASGHLR
jgi:hypothetical protein